MFRRLRRRLERVRLTRASLIRMALGIFGGFVLVGVVVHAVRPEPSFGGRALWVYVEEGPREGERRLVEHLRENPEDAPAWIALARLRSMATSGRLPELPDIEEFLRDPTFELRPRFHDPQPFLGPAEFDAFIASCPVIPVGILRAWRDADQLDRALAHLARAETLEELLAGGQICLESRDPRAPGRAITWFERARALAPGSEEAVSGWIRALGRAGESDEVEAALEDPAVRAAVDPSVLFEHHREREE